MVTLLVTIRTHALVKKLLNASGMIEKVTAIVTLAENSHRE